MNKEYLKHAIVLWVVATSCLFAGIAVEHWVFEAIAVLLFIAGYVLLYILPEPKKQPYGTKPKRKRGIKHARK
jgi:cytochrome c oxidase assembly factor CtaG